MEGKLCPRCNAPLKVEKTETVRYDPIVSLEVMLYYCPGCEYKELAEVMK